MSAGLSTQDEGATELTYKKAVSHDISLNTRAFHSNLIRIEKQCMPHNKEWHLNNLLSSAHCSYKLLEANKP